MIKLRYLRYRIYDRLRHSTKTKEFLASAAARLAAATETTVTAEDIFNMMKDERLSAAQIEDRIANAVPAEPEGP